MQLIAIGGPPGVGKTTLAEAVSQSLGIPHVDFDEATRDVVAHGRSSHPTMPEEELLTLLRSDRYEALARDIAREGQHQPSVIVASAPFTRHSQEKDHWHSWLEKCGSFQHVDFVWLDLDSDTRRQRMIRRGASRDFALLDSGTVLPSAPFPVFPHIRVDAALPLPDQRALVSALVR